MRMYRHTECNLFNQNRLSEYFSENTSRITSYIQQETEGYILNVGKNTYIDYLYKRFVVNIPILDYDNAYLDNYEADIPTSYFPNFAAISYNTQSIRKTVYRLVIPIKGNDSIVQMRPSKFSLDSLDAVVESGYIYISYIAFTDDPQNAKRHFDHQMELLKRMMINLESDINSYNQQIRGLIGDIFQNRKRELLRKNDFVSAIGFPLKKAKAISRTFSVPSPDRRHKIAMKPDVTVKGYAPEPTLSAEDYNSVLKLINDVGLNFERLPSVYQGKQEEDLRDHIIMFLDPQFEGGSATGETFNKQGKTDIMLRYDSSVVFIAECKFWKGKAGYMKTIDQLLSYLTWRDTKTSIIIFAKQKDISKVIDSIEHETKNHPNYVKFVNKQAENWLNYIFHLNGDENREVYVGVQIFHIPQ